MPIVRSSHDHDTRRYPPAPVSTADLTFVPLTQTGTADRATISADGRYLSYVEQIGPDASVWIRQTGNQGTVFAIVNGPFASVSAPAWSPSGRRIAMRGTEALPTGGTGQRVVIVDVASGSANWMPLPTPLAGGGTVAWLSEDALVLSQGEGPAAAHQLWRMSIPAGN
jgi:dipeptidyl aminopeptidase/acylaminoacyl peptidase